MAKKWILWVSIFSFVTVGLESTPIAALLPEKVHVTEGRKSDAYIQDGLFVGGDRVVQDVVIKDLRRAMNPAGYERIVIDLEGSSARTPYYQIAVNRDEKRLILTIWGHPKLSSNPQKIIGAFKKSAHIDSIEFYPQVEDDFMTIVMNLKSTQPVEAFELSAPSRIIIDLKSKARKHLPN